MYNYYTIIGYWPSSMQRFADIVEASSAEEAEQIIISRQVGISVCGIIEGQHECVDAHEFVGTSEH